MCRYVDKVLRQCAESVFIYLYFISYETHIVCFAPSLIISLFISSQSCQVYCCVMYVACFLLFIIYCHSVLKSLQVCSRREILHFNGTSKMNAVVGRTCIL